MRRNGWAILAATTAFILFAAAYFTIGATPAAADNSYWGANYFPNVPLVTQDGKTLHFYDDMLKGKIVLLTPTPLGPSVLAPVWFDAVLTPYFNFDTLLLADHCYQLLEAER